MPSAAVSYTAPDRNVSLWATLQPEQVRGPGASAIAPLDLHAGGAVDTRHRDEQLRGAVITPHVDPDETILEGRIGALYRFGRDLSSPRSEGDVTGWYMFAGADAQALTWRLGHEPEGSGSMRLEDLPMVGDAQAGVALRLGSGDLSIGFIHREIHHAAASADEQFGGVSFVINR